MENAFRRDAAVGALAGCALLLSLGVGGAQQQAPWAEGGELRDAAAERDGVEAEAVPAEPAPDLRLHAVYDEVFPAPEGAETRMGELVVPADIGMPEVRDPIRYDATPLAGPAQLESSSYESDEFGGVLRLQFDRECGRKLEVWAREHLGQRIAVFAGDRLVTAEPVNEGLGRRILVPTLLPLRDGERFDWDGRDERERARDGRDEQAFTEAAKVEQEGRLDWLRRGVSVSDAMDSALDGDMLSNRLLAWLALNSGAEGEQHAVLARLCWLAARDQFELWDRLVGQWPEAGSKEELRRLLADGKGALEGEGGEDPRPADERWSGWLGSAAVTPPPAGDAGETEADELEGGPAPDSPGPQEASPHAPPPRLSPEDLEQESAGAGDAARR